MINFIQKEGKKKMIKSFYFRTIILFLTMVACITLVAVFSTLPAYFMSSVKVGISGNKLEVQKLEPVPLPDQQTMSLVQELNQKLNIIEQARKNQFTISKNVISAIILKKIPSIKITDISYQYNSLQEKKVSIQGTAPSREVLLLFRRALEDDVAFKQVDLPISNFVKGSNIKFYLSLIPRPNDQ